VGLLRTESGDDVEFFPWWSALVAVRPTWRITPRFGLGLAFEGFIALVRPQLLWRGREEPLYRVPLGGGRIMAFFEFEVTKRGPSRK